MPKTLEAHELADLIPPMSDETYTKLRDDIKENGLLEPIALYEGRILDGRHRYRVCQELGIDCPTKDYDGDDPARFVISLNVMRRHLSYTERAAIALAAVPHFREEAKKRQGERVDLTSGPTEPEVAVVVKRAIGQAAAAAGVSRVTVQRLQRVERDDPELHVKVMRGDVSIRKADDELRERQPKDGNAEAKQRMYAGIARLRACTAELQRFDALQAVAAATPPEPGGWINALDIVSRVRLSETVVDSR